MIKACDIHAQRDKLVKAILTIKTYDVDGGFLAEVDLCQQCLSKAKITPGGSIHGS